MKHTYDALASVYDALVDQSIIDTTISLIQQHAACGRVLEVGCGTAGVSSRLARSGYTVDAFDSNETMLEAAAYHVGEEGVRVTLFHHDATQAYAGGYDVVVLAVDVVNHFTEIADVKAVLDHASNALNPRGILVFDALRIDYIRQLVGHEETINVEGVVWRWSVAPFGRDGVRHRIEAHGQVFEHRQRAFVLEDLMTLLSPLRLIARHDTASRCHVVFQK